MSVQKRLHGMGACARWMQKTFPESSPNFECEASCRACAPCWQQEHRSVSLAGNKNPRWIDAHSTVIELTEALDASKHFSSRCYQPMADMG
eukprot:4222540-Amphidinium_carterae.2